MSCERAQLIAAQKDLKTWASSAWKLPLAPELIQESKAFAQTNVTWQCESAPRKSLEELLAKARQMANEVKASAGGNENDNRSNLSASGAATTRPNSQPSEPARAPPLVQKRTWANVAASGKSWAGIAAAKPNAPGAKAPVAPAPKKNEKPKSPRKTATIVDVVSSLAKQKADEEHQVFPGTGLAETAPSVQFSLDHGLSSLSSKAHYSRLGMKNTSNNCYVNVVVQALLPCSGLMQLLSNCCPKEPARPFYSTMVSVFKPFFVSKDKATAMSCRDIDVLQNKKVTTIIQRWRELGSQQDAGEFMFYMLEGMHEECKWKEGNTFYDMEDSPIMRIFGGLARTCVTSNHDSFTVEPFNHLMLEISADTIDSVWTALAAYCGAEAVDDGRATKTIQFTMLPNVLILSVKRFGYNKETQCPTKINKAIKYEEHIRFEQEWLAGGIETKDYQLASIICHHGQFANDGHYTALGKYNADWYMFDDMIVRKTSLAEVLDYQSSAYLLVYVSVGRCSLSV